MKINIMTGIVGLGLVVFGLQTNASGAEVPSFNLLTEKRFEQVACSLDNGECYNGLAVINTTVSFYSGIEMFLDSSRCLPLSEHRVTGTFAISEAQTRMSLSLVVSVYDGTNIIRESQYGVDSNNWSNVQSGRADFVLDLYPRPIPRSSNLRIGLSFQGPGAESSIGLLYWLPEDNNPGITMRHSFNTDTTLLMGTPRVRFLVHPTQPTEAPSLYVQKNGPKVVVGWERGLID